MQFFSFVCNILLTNLVDGQYEFQIQIVLIAQTVKKKLCCKICNTDCKHILLLQAFQTKLILPSKPFLAKFMKKVGGGGDNL